jgi:hypothetical protein
MSYAFDDEDVVTWLPNQPFPERVKAYKGQITPTTRRLSA